MNQSFNVNRPGFGSQLKFLRVNVFWHLVEPQRGSFDDSAIAFYKSYLQRVRAKGFEPVVILGAPTLGPQTRNLEGFLGTPTWALGVLFSPDPVPAIALPPTTEINIGSLTTAGITSFVGEWGAYVRKVAEEMGGLVDYYQVWNEPNALYTALPAPVEIEMFKRARQELDAADPGAQTIVNVLNVGRSATPSALDWRAALALYLTQANSSIDVLAMDYYPGNIGEGVGLSPSDWSALEDLYFIGGVTGKKVAIMETGFTTNTNIPFHFRPAGQQNLISKSLPAILSKVGELNSGVPIRPLTDIALPAPLKPYSPPPFLFAGWYEYYDRNSSESDPVTRFDPESHYGIAFTDRNLKVGADDMRYYINAPRPAGTTSVNTGELGCAYSYVFAVPSDFPRGMHTMAAFASAIDRAQAGLVGNEGSATVNFTVDALPPSVENVTAVPFYTGTENVTITFDVNESVLGQPTVIVQDSAGANRSAVFVGTTGGSNPHFTYRYEVTAADAEGNATIFVFASDLAGNVGEGRGRLVLKDKDADGVFDSRDVCPATPGLAERQGCLLGDLTKVKLQIVDQIKRGDCGFDSRGRAIPSCQRPLAGVLVKIFDRDDPAFIAAYGRDPRKTLLPTIFESGIGWLGNTTPLYRSQGASCITNSSGRCIAGDPKAGNFIVIAKYRDPETGSVAYSGKNKRVEDFDRTEDEDKEGDDKAEDFQPKLAHKSLKVIKTLHKDGTIRLQGGAKSVVVGSMLEIVVPDYTVWANSNETYPFIFTSKENWTVNVCLQVPQGYSIFGVYDAEGKITTNASCTQEFVEGESKVALFELVETGPPEPDVAATITTTSPEGKVTTLTLGIPGQRTRAAAFPLLEILLIGAVGAGAAGAAGAVAAIRRRRRGYSYRPPHFPQVRSQPQPWQNENPERQN